MLVTLAFASAAYTYAAEITWQTSVIMADENDISTTGETRLAVNAGADATVNTVFFGGTTSPAAVSGIASQNGGNESLTIGQTSYYGSFGSGTTTGDLTQLLPGGYYGGTDPLTITFTDLVPGQDYEIQIFTNDARGSRNRNFLTTFDNGLDALDGSYVSLAGQAQLNNSPVNAETDPPGDEQGDYIIGTFTADGTTQSFTQRGSNNGGSSFGGSRSHINAIQLRATGTILPIPAANEALWTGLADANLDNTTANFAVNASDAPLSLDTLTNAVSSGAGVIFADNYTSDPGGTVAVSHSILAIPNGAMPTAPQLTFRNSISTAYSVTSVDSDGITGGSTSVATSDPDTGVAANGGTLTLFGTHSFGGSLTSDFDTTINIGSAATAANLTNASILTNGTINWDTTPGDTSFSGVISGAGTFEKLGTGTLTLSANSTSFSGTTSVSEGTLLATATYSSSTVDIASGATFEIDVQSGGYNLLGTYTGDGVMRFTDSLSTGAVLQIRGVMALSPSAEIEIASGTAWRGSGNTKANWTTNQSDLTIAAGAGFSGVEGRIRINALNGDGNLNTGWTSADYGNNGFTIGVADGSGTFNGDIGDTDTVNNHTGILRKVGTGTQVFGGALTHQRNTIVQNGTFELSSTGSLTFFLGIGDSVSSDGGTNRITGATTATQAPVETGTGNVVIDGAFIFDDTNAATPLAEGDFWVIVDSSELASVSYGANFAPSMLGFALVETVTDSGIWESEDINDPITGVPWIFDESTGILSVGSAVIPDFTSWVNSYLPDDVSDPDADFDLDGITNQKEYLFGLDPTDSSSFNPITVPFDSSAGTISFTRRDPTLTGVVTTIETSTDLVTWARDMGASFTPGAAVNDVETVVAEVSASLLAEPKLFVRIVQGDVTLFSTDFEDGSAGFAPFGSPNDWAFGTPNSNNNAPGDDLLLVTSGNGGSTNCWGTVLGDGATPSGTITVSTNSVLRGPATGIDLTGLNGAELSFAAAMDVFTSDTLEILVKEVGTDATLLTLSAADLGLTGTITADWASYGPFDISGAISQDEAASNNVYLEFRYVGTDGFFIGLYIDDILVRAKP